MKTTIEDDREIRKLCKEWWSIKVGEDGVTKIVPYEEHGQMAAGTWFAIYKGDFLWQRIDSMGLQIIYEVEKE